MPQLSSGRHVAVATVNFVDRVKFGTDVQVLGFIFAYRLEVAKPADLCRYLPVLYYAEGDGTPPNAPTYDSGHTVGTVLEGKALWAEEEILSFSQWLQRDPKLNAWLDRTFAEVHAAILASPLWESELITDKLECAPPN